MAFDPKVTIKTRRGEHKRHGAIMVEAALVLPVLLVIIFATSELCNRIFESQSLTIAAGEAARVAIIPDATLADVVQQAEEIAAKRKLPPVNVNVEPSDFADQPIGTFVQVTVSINTDDFSSGGLFLAGGNAASVSIMKER